MFVFIIICVLAVAIAFLFWMLVFRNNVIEYQEKIKQAKSRVRVEKSTMTRTGRAIQEEHSSVGQSVYSTAPRVNNVGFMHGDMGKASIYSSKTSKVMALSQSHEDAQYRLNEIISAYNRYIRKFPNFIMAAILKCKSEEYIGEEDLQKSTKLDW